MHLDFIKTFVYVREFISVRENRDLLIAIKFNKISCREKKIILSKRSDVVISFRKDYKMGEVLERV